MLTNDPFYTMSIIRDLQKKYDAIFYKKDEKLIKNFISNLRLNGFIGLQHFYRISNFVNILENPDRFSVLSDKDFKEVTGYSDRKEFVEKCRKDFILECDKFNYCLKILVNRADSEPEQVNEVIDFLKLNRDLEVEIKEAKDLTLEQFNEIIAFLKKKAPNAKEICKNEPQTARGKLKNFFGIR